MTPPSIAPVSRPFRFRAALAVALLVTAALAAWEAYTVSWQRQIARLERTSGPRLDRFGILLFAPSARYTYLPHVLANEDLARAVLAQPRDPELVRQANAWLGQLQRRTGTAVLYLLDPQGTGIASSNWQDRHSFVGTNYAFRPYYTRAMETGGAQFYAMGITSRTPGYFLSQRIMSAAGDKVLGVAVVKVDLTMPDVDDYGGEVIVTDAGGVAFLSSRKDWRYRPLQALSAVDGASVARTRQYDGVLREPLDLQVERQLAAGATIVGIAGAGRYFMARKPVPDTDWQVNVLLPLRDIEDAAWRVAWLVAGGFALAVLSLLYLWEFRVRLAERERSRTALEDAHAALARQHDELKSLSDELRIQSSTDSLTGLFNRRHFLDSAERMLGAARRHGEPLALLLIDADHFKRINDEHGHPLGDEVLRMLAGVLAGETRDGDVAARYGGEEFIVALPRADAAAALAVAERMRERIGARQVAVPGGSLAVTVSIGLAVADTAAAFGDDVAQLIRRADEALYRAKHAGRNRVVAAP